MGVLYGYRRTLGYLAGIAAGVGLYMLLAGGVSASLLTLVPAIEKPMRFAGAAYILWLAFKTVQASYGFGQQAREPLGFVNGLVLQAVNVKAIIYGLTLFTSFLTPIAGHSVYLPVSAVILGAVTFVATSTWALAGTAINRYLHRPLMRNAVNVALAGLLVYTAAKIAGVV